MNLTFESWITKPALNDYGELSCVAIFSDDLFQFPIEVFDVNEEELVKGHIYDLELMFYCATLLQVFTSKEDYYIASPDFPILSHECQIPLHFIDEEEGGTPYEPISHINATIKAVGPVGESGDGQYVMVALAELQGKEINLAFLAKTRESIPDLEPGNIVCGKWYAEAKIARAAVSLA